MNDLCSVIVQRPGKPRRVIGVKMTREQAYALAHELAANMVDNKGYCLDGKNLAGGAVTRLVLDGQRVFIGVMQLETVVLN